MAMNPDKQRVCMDLPRDWLDRMGESAKRDNRSRTAQIVHLAELGASINDKVVLATKADLEATIRRLQHKGTVT